MQEEMLSMQGSILSTKHKTILYTEESADKVQALLKKYKEKLKITNTVVELHKK